MARYIVSPRYPDRRYPATETDMRALFGVTGPRWPDAGCKSRLIQGIWVHVLPITHESLRKTVDPRTGRPRRSAKHRCIASCPDCGRAMSPGRLQQHKCSPRPPNLPPDVLKRLQDLSADACHRFEYGSQQQIDADNAFCDLARCYLTETQRADWNAYGLKATTEERHQWFFDLLKL